MGILLFHKAMVSFPLQSLLTGIMASYSYVSLVSQILRICLLREQPQNLPTSDTLVLATAAASAVTYAMANYNEGIAGSSIFLLAGLQVVLFGAVIWIALKLKSFAERWRQTITALFGSSALLQLISLPIVSSFQESIASNTPSLLPGLLVLALGIWYLLIMANVLRHAMELSVGASLVASFVCQMVTVMVLLPLMGSATGS